MTVKKYIVLQAPRTGGTYAVGEVLELGETQVSWMLRNGVVSELEGPDAEVVEAAEAVEIDGKVYAKADAEIAAVWAQADAEAQEELGNGTTDGKKYQQAGCSPDVDGSS